MKTKLLALALLSLALVPGLADLAGATNVKVGDKFDFGFKSVTGDVVTMKDLQGKIVVVDMWATWCGPCMAQAPHMVAINQKYGSKGLQIVGISLDSDKDALVKTIASSGFTWPQFFDGQGWQNKYATQWAVQGIPQTFLIGPDGTVLWEGHPAEIDQPLEDAFKNHPPVLVDPAIVAAANATLDQVDASLAAHNDVAAMKLLASVAPEAILDGTFDTRLEAEKTKLADVGAKLLTSVDPLIAAKQYAEADAKLNDLCKSLAGLPIATEARKKLGALLAMPDAKPAIEKARKEAAGKDALAIAQKLQADKKDEAAYRKYKEVATQFAGTEAGATAATAAAEYEKDKAFIKSINAKANEEKAKSMLSMAKSYRDSGLADKARAKYQAIIDQYPDAPEAGDAKKALAEMGKE